MFALTDLQSLLHKVSFSLSPPSLPPSLPLSLSLSVYMSSSYIYSGTSLNGAEESVIVSEVSSFQRFEMHARTVLGVGKGVLSFIGSTVCLSKCVCVCVCVCVWCVCDR